MRHRDPFITRALAIAAVAGFLGVAHSLVVPVRVTADRPDPGPIPVEPDGGIGTTPDDLRGDLPPDSSPAPAPAPARAPTPVPEAPEGLEPGYLDLAGAWEVWQQGAWFLDARRPVEYAEGHIEGAFLMPSNRVMTSEGQEDLAMIPLDATIVIYCVGGDCDSSENTKIRLQDMDYRNILIMKAGYDDWVNAGHPITTPGGAP